MTYKSYPSHNRNLGILKFMSKNYDHPIMGGKDLIIFLGDLNY